MAGIFISYRRGDTGGHAGRLKADLGERYGRPNVFMDIDSIPAGQRYADPIDQALNHCRVALVLIGEEWLSPVSGRGRRIDEEGDWVRREIAAALKRDDVTVIPILVERASMPSPDELPSDIAALSEIQATELGNREWDYDLEHLCGAIEGVAPGDRIKRSGRWLRGRAKPLGATLTLVVAAVVVAVLATGDGAPESGCANQAIPADVRDRLSVAQGTSRPAVVGSVFYGACDGQSWAMAEFPNDDDGVFKQTGFTWTRLGSIESARCEVPSDLLASWKQGGC